MPVDPRTKQDIAKAAVAAGAGSNGQPATAAPRAHGSDEHIAEKDLPPVSGLGALMIGVVLLALFGGLFLLGWLPHSRKLAAARAEAAEVVGEKPVVDVIAPRRSNASVDLTLPADTQAYQATAIYARTNGYLKPLPPGIDIGAEVKAGQLIAEISAPEIDAELEQAKATLEQAKVTRGRAENEYEFNEGMYTRYKGLAASGGVTDQQLAEKKSSYNISISSRKAAEANVKAAEATLLRFTELQKFQRVTAPFDGVITARNYDAGALISATGTMPGRELFRIAQVDRLRVFVNVPQSYATEVETGQPAELLSRNVPIARGTLSRSAQTIDPATRTMRVEVDVENPRNYQRWNLPFGAALKTAIRPMLDVIVKERALVPGMYAQVRFKIHRDRPPLVVPTGALVFGADGMKVAVVEGGKVRYRQVAIGRDYGSEAEVVNGLTGSEQIVTNPGERLVEGGDVQVTGKKEAVASGGTAKR